MINKKMIKLRISWKKKYHLASTLHPVKKSLSSSCYKNWCISSGMQNGVALIFYKVSWMTSWKVEPMSNKWYFYIYSKCSVSPLYIRKLCFVPGTRRNWFDLFLLMLLRFYIEVSVNYFSSLCFLFFFREIWIQTD